MRFQENFGLILVEDGHLTNRMKKKQSDSMHCFPSVFNARNRPWASQFPEDHECRTSDFPLVYSECSQVSGPDGIHHRVLKEPVDVVAGPFSIIYQRIVCTGKAV